jgi:hypothetical protein
LLLTKVFTLSDVETEAELILARASIFEQPQNVEKLFICPFHRASLGVSWNRRSSKCSIPVILSQHSTKMIKKPKADRGLSKHGSQIVLKETGIFLAVGSGESTLSYWWFLTILFWHPDAYEKNQVAGETKDERTRF